MSGSLDGQAVSEWKPTGRTWVAWTVGGSLTGAAACLIYQWIAGHGQIPTSFTLNLVLLVVLLVAIGALHEGIHGLVALAFGGRPDFGILRAGRVPVGFYTTANGHRFSRAGFVALALAPAVVIVPLGGLLCWTSLGPVLWAPLGVHFGGCVGDLTLVRKAFAAPRGAMIEDLRDRIRIWPASVVG
jgi:hypothetical protein